MLLFVVAISTLFYVATATDDATSETDGDVDGLKVFNFAYVVNIFHPFYYFIGLLIDLKKFDRFH